MIRLADTSDYKRISKIFQLNTPKYFATDELQDFEKFLTNQPQHYFIIESNGTVAGSGGFNLKNDGRVASLVWDLVDPKLHRKGLGSQLVAHRLSELKKMPSLKVIDIRTSTMSYKFYERFGFKTVNYQSDFWAEGMDLYEMELG